MIDPLILFRAVHISATVLATGTVAFRVLVAEPAFAADVAAMLEADFAHCRRAGRDDLGARGRRNVVFRAAVQVARLFSPIQ